ncbi:hypothetical protein D1BOALGB6SA_6719 [Olavius sp. associated proteobacterium Delta 1]|nr:hypothetical protein D1BOALGB6SA_6719 [Olavius sp. associated proteobacterium Delta 1]
MQAVIAAKAGIQKIRSWVDWMPAFAGVTNKTSRTLIYLVSIHIFGITKKWSIYRLIGSFKGISNTIFEIDSIS